MNPIAVVLTVLLLAAWGLLAFDLYGIVTSGPLMGGEDRYSRGWELLWAFALTTVVWLFLIFLLRSLQASGAWLLWLVSAGAAAGAYYLMGDGEPRWPAAIPLALPLLLMGAALSGHWSGLRTPLLAIAAVPCLWAAGTFGFSWIAQDSGKRAVQSEIRERNMAIVAQIDETQPLWRWMKLLEDDSGVRDEALAAMRKLHRRQADIEQMAAEGAASEAIDLIPLLDLQPTQALKDLLNAKLMRDAAYAHTKPGGGNRILEGDFMFGALPALRWMHAHGGCCRDGIQAMKAAALEYEDTKVRAGYLKELDALLK